MSYSCKILLDSISETNKRITTFEITFPRIVLAEFNTHRMFSRNSASSRAIPFEKQVAKVFEDPFVPEQFPVNCIGMQPQTYITKDDTVFNDVRNRWLAGLDFAVATAKVLKENHDIHKQILNRLLESFMWHTVIVTATEFDNFFKLRCDENAQYEIRRIADLMYEAYHAFDNEKDLSVVSHNYIGDLNENFKAGNNAWSAVRLQKLKIGEWHCPLVYEEDEELIQQYIQTNSKLTTFTRSAIDYIKKKVSVARCARVSYLTHDGKRDIEKDLELFERLRTSGHWSPFEHVATPLYDENTFNYYKLNKDKMSERKISRVRNQVNLQSGNFIGWMQFRKEFPDENCTEFRKEN